MPLLTWTLNSHQAHLTAGSIAFGNRAPEESAIADFAALNVDKSADPNLASELYVGRYPADAKLPLDSRDEVFLA